MAFQKANLLFQTVIIVAKSSEGKIFTKCPPEKKGPDDQSSKIIMDENIGVEDEEQNSPSAQDLHNFSQRELSSSSPLPENVSPSDIVNER